MKEEYKGLLEACKAVYGEGLEGNRLIGGSVTSVGIPAGLILSFYVDGKLFTSNTRVQALLVLNEAGLEGLKVDGESLEDSITRQGEWKSLVAPVFVEYTKTKKPEVFVGNKTPEPDVEDVITPEESEFIEEVINSEPEEVVQTVFADEKYLKSIRGEKDADKEAKALLLAYAATFPVEVDKRKGFKKMASELRKGLKTFVPEVVEEEVNSEYVFGVDEVELDEDIEVVKELESIGVDDVGSLDDILEDSSESTEEDS